MQVLEYQSGLLVAFPPTGIHVLEYQSGLLVAFPLLEYKFLNISRDY